MAIVGHQLFIHNVYDVKEEKETLKYDFHLL